MGLMNVECEKQKELKNTELCVTLYLVTSTNLSVGSFAELCPPLFTFVIWNDFQVSV